MNEKKKGFNILSKPFLLCDRDRIQTYNLLIRSQMLYSIELRSHFPLADGKNKGILVLGKINIKLNTC